METKVYCYLITLFAITDASNLIPPEYNMKQMYFKVCGEELSNTVALVCDNHYKGKRGDKGLLDDLNSFEKYETNEILMPQPFQFPFESLFKSNRNKREARVVRIVDECCHKGCSYEEMRGYCGDD